MMNAINRALDEAAKAAREQTNQLLNELNSASESMMAAKVNFEREMTEARKLHELSEQKQAEAIRNFDSNLIQMNAVIVALKRQIADGEIITGLLEEAQIPAPPGHKKEKTKALPPADAEETANAA